MRSLAGPLMVVAARARRSRSWVVPTLALALVFGIAGALTSESVIAADQGSRAVLRRLAPVDRTIRLVWEGLLNRYAIRTADTVFSRLGTGPPTEALLLNPVRLSDTIVHPVAISPLGRWVPPGAVHRLGPCRPADCPVLLDGRAHLPPTLTAFGVRLRVVGRVSLSPVPLGYSPVAEQSPPVLITGDIAGLGAINGLSGVYRTFSWTAPLSLAHLHSWSLPGFESQLAAAQAALSPLSTRFTFEGPFGGLDAARTRASVAVHRLILVDGGIVVVLVLFVLLAAGALRRDQAAEVGRLRNAGARSGHVAAFLAAEAAWLSAVAVAVGVGLAVLFTVILAQGSGEPPGGVLAHGVLSWSAAAALAGAWVATTLILALSPLVPTRRIVDLAALAGAAVLVAGLALGTDSTSAWAGLLVPLVCLSAGLVLFRALGPLLRVGERLARRGSLRVRLALVSLGRAGGGAGLAISFLAVSTGLGGFGLAFRATLLRGAADQAANRVPLDALVSAGSSFSTPLQLAPPARWQALSHGRVFPVRRTEANYPLGVGTASVPALGVPAGALPLIHGWRASDGPASLAALARRLQPPGPARTPGPSLPATAHSVELAVRSPNLDLVVTLDLRSPAGAVRRVTLGTTGLHPRLLRAGVPPGRWEAEAIELSELSGTAITNAHQNGENPAPATQFSARLTMGPLLATDNGGGVVLRQDLGAWRAVGAASGAAPPGAGGSAPAGGLHAPATAVVFQTTGWPGVVRPSQPSDSRPLPVLADPRTAAAAGPGGRIGLTVDGVPVQARVEGVLRRFPTIPAGASGFVVVDQASLSGALDAQLPGQGRPDELWISTSRPEALRAALRRTPLSQLTASFRGEVERSLRSDPVASGVTRTLLAGGAVAGVLALLGMVLVLVGPFRELRVEADLEEQGFGPSELRRELRVRWATACVVGIWPGLLIALLLDRLAVAAVGSYESGTSRPSLITVFPGLQLAALGVAATVVCLVCGFVIGEALWPRRRGKGPPKTARLHPTDVAGELVR